MPYLKAVPFFKDAGVFNSFKAERKAKFNSSFLSVYLLSPGTSQVTGSEECKKQQDEILWYLAQNTKSRVG